LFLQPWACAGRFSVGVFIVPGLVVVSDNIMYRSSASKLLDPGIMMGRAVAVPIALLKYAFVLVFAA
jgi:hypothetical protein